jgi:integrase
MTGAEPGLRFLGGEAFRRRPGGSAGFRTVSVSSSSLFARPTVSLFELLGELRQLAYRDVERSRNVADGGPGRVGEATLDDRQRAQGRAGCELIFTTPSGRMWRERNFYRDVWRSAQEASGLDIRPHECRHSYVTHLRAAGVNDADLAEIAGHRVETMLARYTHAVGRSLDAVREAVG